jgi:hypothetical protein
LEERQANTEKVLNEHARMGFDLRRELFAKFSAVEFADRPDALHLITHLSRAGWLRWHETAAAAPPKPGRGPLQFRVHLDAVGGPGFDLTEAGTQKRLAVYVVRSPYDVAGIARVLGVSRASVYRVLQSSPSP